LADSRGKSFDSAMPGGVDGLVLAPAKIENCAACLAKHRTWVSELPGGIASAGEAAGQTGVAADLRGYAGAAELTLIAGLTVFSGLAAILYLSQRRRSMERRRPIILSLWRCARSSTAPSFFLAPKPKSLSPGQAGRGSRD